MLHWLPDLSPWPILLSCLVDVINMTFCAPLCVLVDVTHFCERCALLNLLFCVLQPHGRTCTQIQSTGASRMVHPQQEGQHALWVEKFALLCYIGSSEV